MSIDAMQQALKALESINDMSKPPMDIALPAEIDGAMDALRKAIREAALDGLAQTSQEIEWDTSDMAYRPNGLSVEQEPVAWVRDLTSPQPHCVTSIKYLSIADTDAGVKYIPVYTALPSKPWVSLNDRDITGAAHNKAKYPVSILETTDSGLCMQFSETGEWHASDKHGDFMKVNSFLMSFARAIEALLRERNK